MQQTYIFWPMLAVLFIPFFVLILNGKRKLTDKKAGLLKPEAAVDNTAWSLPVVLTSNALANQFQLPVMFYTLCIIIFSIGAVSGLVIILCWFFAVTRWIHVIVHVSTNSIPLRQGSFILGALTLLILFGATVYSMANM